MSMAKRLTAGITKKTRGAQLICGKKILPNSDHADTFAQIANRTKETSDTPIAGRKAANTFAVKILLAIGVILAILDYALLRLIVRRLDRSWLFESQAR